MRPLVSISRKRLADSIVEEITRRIENGELKEGDKLPNQHEFAAQLGVSRTVLRETLHTLAILGLVDQRPKSGTVIRDKTPIFCAEHLIPPLMAGFEATAELIEARRYIEVGASVSKGTTNSPEEKRG